MAGQMPQGFIPDGFVPDPAPAPEQPSAASRFGSELYNKSPLPAVGAALSGTANVVAHPVDTLLGIKPLVGAGKDLLKAQWDEAVKAAQKVKEAAGDKNPLTAVEALGHGMAALLPILGPAAANVGEHGAQGDVAGMMGGATGLLAPFAVKYGLELKNAPNPGKADLLRRDAEQTVSQRVLAPGNPKYKGTAENIAPEVLSRKLQGSRLELQQIADEGMTAAADKIDEAVQAHKAMPAATPGAAHGIDTAPIVKAIDDRLADFSSGGKIIPTAAAKVQHLTALRDYIAGLGKTVPFEELRKVRDDFYRAADEAKGYQGPDINVPDAGWAAREAGSAIRSQFSKDVPGLAAANADYTFFKRLGDVLDPTLGRPKLVNGTPVGITGGLATAGAVAGHAMGTGASLVLARLLPAIQNTVNSPAWQLAKAAQKTALADAIEAGQMGRATSLLTTIAAMAPRPKESQ